MEFRIGDKLKYIFPDSINSGKAVFIGIVDFVGDSLVTLRNEKNTILKVSFKNFHLLERLEYLPNSFYPASENYFG